MDLARKSELNALAKVANRCRKFFSSKKYQGQSPSNLDKNFEGKNFDLERHNGYNTVKILSLKFYCTVIISNPVLLYIVFVPFNLFFASYLLHLLHSFKITIHHVFFISVKRYVKFLINKKQ